MKTALTHNIWCELMSLEHKVDDLLRHARGVVTLAEDFKQQLEQSQRRLDKWKQDD